MASNKDKAAYNRAMAAFETRFTKAFGEDTIETAEIRPYEVISTGSLDLDLAMGVGGYVEGRIHQLWGPQSIGKTTMALIAIAQAQMKYPHRMCCWVDMEGTLDEQWAKDHGVDLARLKIITPRSAEDAADAVKMAIESGLFAMVVIDSIGAFITEKQMEKDAAEATVGDVAKLVTRMVNMAAVHARVTSTAVIIINQIRANIGGYGADTDTPGGFALKHVLTMNLKLRGTATSALMVKLDGIKNPVEVGKEIAVVVEKNKVAPPKRTGTLTLIHTSSAQHGPIGLDVVDEAVTVGIKTKVIAQGGGGYFTLHTGERIRGRDAVVEAIRSQPGLVEEIRTRALATVADDIVVGEEAEVEPDTSAIEEMQGKVVASTGGGRFAKAAEVHSDD